MDKGNILKSIDKVLKDIGLGKTAPVYLLFGEEEYFISEAFKKLVNSLVPEEFRSLNLEVFKGENLNLDAVITGLSSYPFFQCHKVIALLDSELLDSHAANLEPLVKCLEGNIPHQNHLIITTTKSVAKKNILFKKIQETGEILEFKSEKGDKLKYSNLYSKVNERLRREKKKIFRPAFDELIERAGFDPRMIFFEIEKLLIFINDKEEIEKSDVEAVIPLTKQQIIFDLLDAISRKDREGALVVLENLLLGGEAALKINNMIARQIRLLLQAKDFLNNESGRKFNDSYSYPYFQKAFDRTIGELKERYGEDSYNLFSSHPFFVYKVLKLALHWSQEALLGSFKLLHSADIDLKSTSSQEKVILQKLILGFE